MDVDDRYVAALSNCTLLFFHRFSGFDLFTGAVRSANFYITKVKLSVFFIALRQILCFSLLLTEYLTFGVYDLFCMRYTMYFPKASFAFGFNTRCAKVIASWYFCYAGHRPSIISRPIGMMLQTLTNLQLSPLPLLY